MHNLLLSYAFILLYYKKIINLAKFFKVLYKRITKLIMHPATDHVIIFAGDGEGFLSVFKCSSLEDLSSVQNDSYQMSMIRLHKNSINAITIDPLDYNKLYTSCFNSEIMLFDLTKQKSEIFLSDNNFGKISFTNCSRDPHQMYCGTWDGNVMFLDTRTKEYTNTIELGTKRVYSISEHPIDHHYLAIAEGRYFLLKNFYQSL